MDRNGRNIDRVANISKGEQSGSVNELYNVNIAPMNCGINRLAYN